MPERRAHLCPPIVSPLDDFDSRQRVLGWSQHRSAGRDGLAEVLDHVLVNLVSSPTGMVFRAARAVKQQTSRVVLGEERGGNNGAFRTPQFHGVSRYLVRNSGAPVCRNRRVGAAGKAEKQRCRVLYLCFPSQGIYARVGLRDPATEVHQQVETVAAKVHQRSAPAPGFVPTPLAGAGWGVTR